MRSLKGVFLLFLAAVIVSFCLLHLAVNLYGKALLTKKLKSIFNREVTVASVRSSFPFTIIIKDIEVTGLLRVNEVKAEGGAVDIFRRGFSLSSLKLVGLVAHVEKPLKVAVPQMVPFAQKLAISARAMNATPDTLATLRIHSLFLSVKHLLIRDGNVTFVDKSVGEKGITITIKDLNLNVENLCLPMREHLITSFDLRAAGPWQEGQEEGKVYVEGWIDMFKRSMDASVKIDAIDGAYLNPYYSRWVNLEKARVEKVKLNFTGDIHGLNNNVTAVCHLELSDIVFKPRPIEEEPLKAEKIATAVMGILKTMDQGKMVLDFTIRTKMDRPEFSFGPLREAFQDKIIQGKKSTAVQEAAQLPGKLLEGLFKGAKDLTTAVVVGTLSAGKEVGRTIGISFKKEKKE